MTLWAATTKLTKRMIWWYMKASATCSWWQLVVLRAAIALDFTPKVQVKKNLISCKRSNQHYCEAPPPSITRRSGVEDFLSVLSSFTQRAEDQISNKGVSEVPHWNLQTLHQNWFNPAQKTTHLYSNPHFLGLIGGTKYNQIHHFLIDWFGKIHHFFFEHFTATPLQAVNWVPSWNLPAQHEPSLLQFVSQTYGHL
jgi:hypothetical protein